jgi:dipeptidase E
MAIKLFLTSTEILPHQYEYLEKLAGKPLTEISCGLIENAADPYNDDSEDSFKIINRNALADTKLKITPIDLRSYTGDFSEFDMIWLGGGNTFYLRWLIEENNFKDKIVNFAKSGKIYAGSSAGTIVAGPTIEDVDTIDDPDVPPQRIDEGLNITKYVVLPHVNNPDCKDEIAESAKRIQTKNLDLIEIEDGMIFIQKDDTFEIL